MRDYYVYILASRTRTLYVGVTNNLARRVEEHKLGHGSTFARRYNVDRLVYAECFRSPRDAISREKQIKRWRRSKKVALIEAVNPKWEDLAAERGT